MNNGTIGYVLGIVGALAAGILIGQHSQTPLSRDIVKPALNNWIIVPAGDRENDAAWKINTSNGETRLCLLNGVQKVGCVAALEATSLSELASNPFVQ